MFEEHRHCATVIELLCATVDRTPAGNADALGKVVPLSSPAENCSRNALHSPLATFMFNVRWKTNRPHPFTSHKSECREFTQVRNIEKHY